MVATAHATDESVTPTSQRRGVNIALWAIQVITAIGFASVAFAKFSLAPMVVEVFNAMGVGVWMPYTIGVLEIAGAVALLIPRLSGLAGIAFVGLTFGAVVTHLIFVGNLAPAAVMLILSTIVAVGRRRATAALIESVRSSK